jgi:uncharacterized protein YktA (UPF0223 family)
MLSSYAYGIENFYPGDGEAGLLNSYRRFIEPRRSEISPKQAKQLADADEKVSGVLARAMGTWEEDEMRDLVEFLQQEQRTAA